MFLGQLKFVDFSANPFGLVGIAGEKRQSFSPFVAGFGQGVLFFELICFGGNAE